MDFKWIITIIMQLLINTIPPRLSENLKFAYKCVMRAYRVIDWSKGATEFVVDVSFIKGIGVATVSCPSRYW